MSNFKKENSFIQKKTSRAHVLGQRYIIPHIKVHIWMLKIGIRNKSWKDVLGQVIRIPLGFMGSLTGVVPIGNTGGSNVKLFKKMEIPKDLVEVLSEENNR